MALTLGVSDPLRFLDVDRDDWLVERAVLEQAQKIRNERDQAIIEALTKGVGAEVARSVAKILRKMSGR